MGLGDIYINLKGREGQGIVAPGAEYEERAAARSSPGSRSSSTRRRGRRPVVDVFTREEAYGTYDAGADPRPLRHEHRGYRVGWQGSLGVVTPEMFEDNKQVWSGDHCSVDPALVPGILFSNRKLSGEGARASPTSRRPS